jgi:ABC-type Zn uptake system ZnuABC Zn-binding protein ZnuA
MIEKERYGMMTSEEKLAKWIEDENERLTYLEENIDLVPEEQKEAQMNVIKLMKNNIAQLKKGRHL